MLDSNIVIHSPVFPAVHLDPLNPEIASTQRLNVPAEKAVCIPLPLRIRVGRSQQVSIDPVHPDARGTIVADYLNCIGMFTGRGSWAIIEPCARGEKYKQDDR